jgi:hypothetical protein
MKHRTLLIAAALAALLFTGCSKSGSQVQVVSAVFGEYTNFTDVTPRVKGLLQLQTGFQVQTTILQADPFPRYHKVLVIVYLDNGRRHIFTASENDTVSAEILLQAARQ